MSHFPLLNEKFGPLAAGQSAAGAKPAGRWGLSGTRSPPPPLAGHRQPRYKMAQAPEAEITLGQCPACNLASPLAGIVRNRADSKQPDYSRRAIQWISLASTMCRDSEKCEVRMCYMPADVGVYVLSGEFMWHARSPAGELGSERGRS